jgi:uncharacterized membrane protein YozB (DUF420 family)
LFFSAMAILLAATVLAGFSRTYYFNEAVATPFPLSPLLHWHGAVYSTWLVLLVTQTTLIARGQVSWHRRIGFFGCAVAAAMIVLGIAVAVTRTASGVTLDRGVPPLVFLAVPLLGMPLFAILFGAAVLLRRQVAVHKRLMLLATLEIVTAAVARLPFVENWGPIGFFGVIDLFVLAMLAYDLIALKRVHPATVWGGLFFVLSQPLRLLVGSSAAWLSFASWLTST